MAALQSAILDSAELQLQMDALSRKCRQQQNQIADLNDSKSDLGAQLTAAHSYAICNAVVNAEPAILLCVVMCIDWRTSGNRRLSSYDSSSGRLQAVLCVAQRGWLL